MLSIYLLALIVVLLCIALFYLARNNNEKTFTELTYKLNTLQTEIQRIETAVKTEIVSNRRETFDNAANARNELANSLISFKHDLAESIHQFNSIQRDNFFALLNKQSEQNTDTGNRLDSMRQTLEKKIGDMQQG